MADGVEKIKEILGENLVMLAEYHTGDEKSILAVCNALDFEILRDLKQLKEIPLVLTKEELLNGVDVFPLEFLNIKQHNRILSGEDLLKDITISKNHLRHQLEFEFRGKLLHLREEYLQFKGKDLENLILSAVPTLAPILGGLMYLKDRDYGDAQDMFKTVSDAYGIDMNVLKDIYDIKHGRSKFKKDKELYIKDLIRILHEIGKFVDEFEVK